MRRRRSLTVTVIGKVVNRALEAGGAVPPVLDAFENVRECGSVGDALEFEREELLQ